MSCINPINNINTSYVYFINLGGFFARLRVGYNYGNQSYCFESKALILGESVTFDIPVDAVNLFITIEAAYPLNSWTKIYDKGPLTGTQLPKSILSIGSIFQGNAYEISPSLIPSQRITSGPMTSNSSCKNFNINSCNCCCNPCNNMCLVNNSCNGAPIVTYYTVNDTSCLNAISNKFVENYYSLGLTCLICNSVCNPCNCSTINNFTTCNNRNSGSNL